LSFNGEVKRLRPQISSNIYPLSKEIINLSIHIFRIKFRGKFLTEEELFESKHNNQNLEASIRLKGG
jgi:hypothetical protein